MEPTSDSSAPAGWEARLLERFAFAALQEQRRARRWRIFFNLVFVFLLVLFIGVLFSDVEAPLPVDEFTALVDVQGIIDQNSAASAELVVSGLRAAFEHENTAGVIIRINSPGGSPVQAGYINDEIFRLREEYPDTPVYAVLQDTCASGGYYVASAADEIYADKASVVGSIGVISDGFGFVSALEKLGIERRLLTAGDNKGFLDPFSPLDPEETEQFQTLLNTVHEQFINTVMKGRRDRLSDNPALFSGFVWTGEQSLALGLVDGLGSASYVAREVIGAEEIVDFTPKRSLLDRLAMQVGTSLANTLYERLFVQTPR